MLGTATGDLVQAPCSAPVCVTWPKSGPSLGSEPPSLESALVLRSPLPAPRKPVSPNTDQAGAAGIQGSEVVGELPGPTPLLPGPQPAHCPSQDLGFSISFHIRAQPVVPSLLG